MTTPTPTDPARYAGADLRLAAVDLSRNRATANGAAKPLLKTVRSCMP